MWLFIHSVNLKTQHFYLNFFRVKVSIVEIILLELFCLLKKNMNAAFCRSLEVMRSCGRKKVKIIIFSHKIFLNDFFSTHFK